MNRLLRTIVTVTFWNFMMGAVVFLPVFMAGVKLTSMALGFPLAERGLGYELGDALLLYLGMSVPVIPGVLAHSALVCCLLPIRSNRYFQIEIVAFAPLVPLTPQALGILGGDNFAAFRGATVAATVAYGVAGAAWLMKTRRAFQRGTA